MTSEKIDNQQRTPSQIALHALGGILIGLLVVAIPFSLAYESASGLQAIHWLASLGFTAFCGTVSAIGGDKMLDRIAAMATYLSF
jgi:hypothetical protein